MKSALLFGTALLGFLSTNLSAQEMHPPKMKTKVIIERADDQGNVISRTYEFDGEKPEALNLLPTEGEALLALDSNQNQYVFRHFDLDWEGDSLLDDKLEELKLNFRKFRVDTEVVSFKSDSLFQWIEDVKAPFKNEIKLLEMQLLQQEDFNSQDSLDAETLRMLQKHNIELKEGARLVVLKYAGEEFSRSEEEAETGELVSSEEQLEVVVYPNPSGNTLNLRMSGLDKLPISIQVVDSEGGEIYNGAPSTPAGGKLDLKVELPPLESGLYLLNIRQGERHWQERIILN